jgi:hypothetical protein
MNELEIAEEQFFSKEYKKCFPFFQKKSQESKNQNKIR